MGLGENKARLLGISAARRTERSVLPSLRIPSDLYYYVTVFSQIAPCILTSSIRSVLTEIVSLPDPFNATSLNDLLTRDIFFFFFLEILSLVSKKWYQFEITKFFSIKKILDLPLFIHLFIYFKRLLFSNSPSFPSNFFVTTGKKKKRKGKERKKYPPHFQRFAHSDALIAHYVP